jgi:hypothetical protein
MHNSFLELSMRFEWLDWENSLTDNFHEIYTVLGLQSARAYIISELMKILPSDELDPRHLALLVAKVTSEGIEPVNRSGITVGDVNPCVKLTFEVQATVLADLLALRCTETLADSRAAFMMGARMGSGTGGFGLRVGDTMEGTPQWIEREPGNAPKEAVLPNGIHFSSVRGSREALAHIPPAFITRRLREQMENGVPLSNSSVIIEPSRRFVESLLHAKDEVLTTQASHTTGE